MEVEVRLLQLVLEVGHGAQALHDAARAELLAEVDEKPGEGHDLDVGGHALERDGLADHVGALLEGEGGAPPVLVHGGGHGHRHPGEEPPGAADDVDVSERHRIEGARDDDVGDGLRAHAHSPSGPAAGACAPPDEVS